ncbi:MAG TPA: DUF4190 domain-containing protein [Mycobacteriales bacterium]|nr:DUF4190 domain-containing protein [Mycobacteriales bacterium]
MRLLPGALACINCELPLTPTPAADEGTPESPPPYAVPQPYSPYAPAPDSWPPYGGPQPVHPGPGYYGGPPGPAPWTTNGMAVASLILALLWMVGIGSVLAIIFGHVSRRQMRKRPQRGDGLALAGLIIGYLGLVGAIVFFAFLPRIIDSDLVQNQLVQDDLKSAASAERHYYDDNSTYTNDGADLRLEGFDPLGRDTILAGSDGANGYCIVGAHHDSSTWYLYDSSYGLSDQTYPTEQAAEGRCSVQVSSQFNLVD